MTAMFGTLSGNPGYVTSADVCTLDHVYRIRDESPIVLNFDEGPPIFTDAEVMFDLSGCGTPQILGWTARGANEGFLALDRDGDGSITTGAELFGNFTPIEGTSSLATNGFEALAAYDKIGNGGNGDGWISSADSVFSRLRVWIDSNHDGVSAPSELKTLDEMNVVAISVSPRESRRRDQYGNEFRFSAPFLVRNARGKIAERRAVDVYLVHK